MWGIGSPPSMKLIRRYVEDGTLKLTFEDEHFILTIPSSQILENENIKPKYRSNVRLALALQGIRHDDVKTDEGDMEVFHLGKPWMNPKRWNALHELLKSNIA